LTDKFVEDLGGLSKGLASKAQKLAVELTRISRQEVAQKLSAGWRLHKLKSSPFVSLSLDMNFRILCKMDGEAITLYRVVKHDLADSSRINRDDSRSADIGVESSRLEVKDLYQSLSALGLQDEEIIAFANVSSEEDLLLAIDEVPEHVAEFALGLMEMDDFIYSRTKYRVFNGDEDFELALLDDLSQWDIYLHPSQEFLVDYPLGINLIVQGGAGTGKTVCAWHRAKHIADSQKYVAFICPTNKTLAVSKSKLKSLLGDAFQYCLFMSADNFEHSLDAIDAASHIVIDEAQDFPIRWWHEMKKHLLRRRVSLTCFLDQNQRNNNSKAPKAFAGELEDLELCLSSLPNARHISLSLNYRNSSEVAAYFSKHLSDALPYPIKADVPVFQSASVLEQNLTNEADALILVHKILSGLKKEFNDEDIAVVAWGASGINRRLLKSLAAAGTNVTTYVDSPDALWVAKPSEIKGHERKAVICISPPLNKLKDRYKKAIGAYVSFSRARDRLFVISVESFA
jgi:hypothetical protein